MIDLWVELFVAEDRPLINTPPEHLLYVIRPEILGEVLFKIGIDAVILWFIIGLISLGVAPRFDQDDVLVLDLLVHYMISLKLIPVLV